MRAAAPPTIVHNRGMIQSVRGKTRSVIMARYLAEIAWGSEVWVADAPTHLIRKR
jgi:BsuBI/PstI restriction endonuclease domain